LGPRIKALLVWPCFPPSFWTFQAMMPIIGKRAMLPPLGLITVAALCPPAWTLRLVDCSIEPLLDSDILWADLLMLSGMHVQRDEVKQIAERARSLNRRVMIGGPYASSQPDVLLEFADHVVTGEPDDIFHEIARDVELGTAKRRYDVREKPDLAAVPIPRFDLLKLDKYSSMAVQFSRGCPFECEFCDIITLYGRKPRTKNPQQLLAEFEKLHAMGWRQPIFIVDDNFVGNQKRALELCREIERWQGTRGWPFVIYTEASIDLAERIPLLEAMVAANFMFVFVGIESPDTAALKEARKFQNLRKEQLASIRTLQRKGLWVMGGFIVGFDSDSTDIFERQRAFIEQAAIPWAMAGFLQAPPTTALFDRMASENRLLWDSRATSNFSLPNFRTVRPLRVLVEGLRGLLDELYEPARFYDRAFRSLLHWRAPEGRRPPASPLLYQAITVIRSIVIQGLLSPYRRAYWWFLIRLLVQWRNAPLKRWWAFTLLISGDHFIKYKREVLESISEEFSHAGTEFLTPAQPAR